MLGRVALLLAVPAIALADPEPPRPTYDSSDPGQALGASVGLATGSSVTPGGLRVEGHYLYQATQDDWLEATASLTLGGGTAKCFYDRAKDYTCDHGLLDGKGAEITGAIRHDFTDRRQGAFVPFSRVGVGILLARFGDDGVTGFGVTARGGLGVRASVADHVAIVTQAEASLGWGAYGHDLGSELVFGLAVLAGAEFTLE